jgi:hypothetical protein
LLVFPSGFGNDNELRRVHNQLQIDDDDTKFVYEPDDIRLANEGLEEHILGIFDLQFRDQLRPPHVLATVVVNLITLI